MNKEKLKRIPHFFSAAIILLHALERFEAGHHTYLIFLLCGIIFFSLAVFHHKIAHRMPRIDVVFYCIESLLSFIIAAEYFSAEKKGLPFVYLIAGLLQIVAVFVFVRKSRKKA